ncbi:hypothetical protein BLA29_000578 [Euroglyphus maynei]|uniref:Uncharacterized protein n=1 Tax=Euroglyphus maynei TaxID=6958 RepID=A0A1Y3APC3_EURMA|nr:hypothetical protein BLA29_000578 [Euroglyphus maynei]
MNRFSKAKNHRPNKDEKFELQKKCIAIDLKVDEINLKVDESNNLKELVDLRCEIHQQNREYRELVRMIFAKTNVEKPLMATVQQLGQKIKEYEEKINRKCDSLKSNGIPTELKSSSKPTKPSPSPSINDKSLRPTPTDVSPSNKSESGIGNDASRPYFRRVDNIPVNEKSSTPKKLSILNEFKMILNNRNTFVDVDSMFDDDEINIRIANGGDLIFDKNPDPTIVEPPVANLEKDWKMNMKNFLQQYHDLPSHELINKFRRSRAPKLLYLSPNDRIEIFNSMLNELAGNYYDEHDKLIVPFTKMAENIDIPLPHSHIIEWALEIVKAGLYSDIVDFRKLQSEIDQCKNDTLRSTLNLSFESKKIQSLDRFRGTIHLLGTMFNKNISKTVKEILEIARILSRQSKYREIYLELFADFILMVGPKLFLYAASPFSSSSSNGDGSKNSITAQLKEFSMKFIQPSDKWPDHLENK